MLVVVSIIVILASVVIAVGVAVKTNSQRAQTKVTLKALMTLYNSYVQETGTTAASTDTNPANFISIARQMPQCAKAINALSAAINPSNSTVVDGFGNLIVMQNSMGRAPAFQSYGPMASQCGRLVQLRPINVPPNDER